MWFLNIIISISINTNIVFRTGISTSVSKGLSVVLMVIVGFCLSS